MNTLDFSGPRFEAYVLITFCVRWPSHDKIASYHVFSVCMLIKLHVNTCPYQTESFFVAFVQCVCVFIHILYVCMCVARGTHVLFPCLLAC